MDLYHGNLRAIDAKGEKIFDQVDYQKYNDYIAEDSVDAAKRVKKSLIHLGGSLGHFPEKYSREEFLADQQENYRSVSKWRYKLIYEVTDNYIIIVDVFNTSQNPSKIRKVKGS